MRQFVIALVVCTSFVARAADTPKSSDLARQHFEEGTAAYNLGEFTRAANEYKEAYRLIRDPVILYNIAQAYRLANDFQEAIFFYKSYLRSLPNSRNRHEVEGRIAALEEQLSKQKSVATAPPNEVVPPRATTRPPAPEPSTPPAEAPPPSPPAHAATAIPPSSAPPSSAPPSNAPPVVAEPSTPPAEAPHAEPVPAGAMPAVAAEAPPRKTPVYKKWWLWTAVGVVVVGAAVGTGVAVGLSGSHAPSSDLGSIHAF